MNLIMILLFLSAGAAAAQVRADSLMKQLPDSSSTWNKQELQRWWLTHPRIESDGVVIENTKYFIRIVKPDTMIDPGMVMKIPQPRDYTDTLKRFEMPDKRPQFR